jgi:protein-disulfide isomerase
MDYQFQPNNQPVTKKSKTVVTLLVIFVVLLAVDGLLAFDIFQRGDSPFSNSNQTTSGSVATTDDPYAGGVSAPIVIVEFGDFQCPYCLQEFPIVRQIMQTYGDKIKFIYRDFPDSVKHSDANKAAAAGECAHAQGKFWAMHDKMFTNQQDLSVAALKRYASAIGVNADQFNSCLDSDRYAKEIEQDFVVGYNAGVQGTPTLFINGRMFEGVIDLNSFKKIIDQLLILSQ